MSCQIHLWRISTYSRNDLVISECLICHYRHIVSVPWIYLQSDPIRKGIKYV